MIGILPETKRREDGISAIYLTISISTICRLIKLCESKEPVSSFSRRRIRLWGEITKQLGAIIYGPITIAIQREPGVI
jgi:hypothetical protein